MSDNKAHSPIGASSMERWRNCPGSVKLSAGIPQLSSSYAEEGTKAHDYAAACLAYLIDGGPKPDDFDISPEMSEATDTYINHVMSQVEPGDTVMIEHRFNLSNLYPDLFGTADTVIYKPKKMRLIVDDFKYGAGVFVDAENNDQLLYYALGAAISLDLKIRTVRIEIVQPRIGVGDPIRFWDTDIYRLWEFADELVNAARRTAEENAPLVAGSWCRFCPAAVACPLLKEQARALAKRVFAPVGPKGVDMHELAETLDWLPVLEGWISSTREFAYERAVAGEAIPFHKIVEKKGRRKWIDEPAAADKLLLAGAREDGIYKPRALLSPAKIEKAFKNLKTLVKDLAETRSSGYKLVHETDPGEPVQKIDAKLAFGPASDEED